MWAAIALGKSGALYPGANIEIPRSGLNQAVHAERSAIANAFGHKEEGIAAIAVTAAPCGHCRQFMNEISGGGQIRVLISDRAPQPLQVLLPDSFGPADLGLTSSLFTQGSTVPSLKTDASDALSEAALAAAARSYAPHTKALSGCAIILKSGTIVSGSYLENAAFNPSLAPLQSALVSVVMRQEEFADITRVALVELANATISHEAATRMVLAALAPRASLDVVTATL